MSLLTGRDGVLRIFDSAAVLHGTAPRDDATPDIVTWDGAASWANITADVEADDTNYASNFLADNAGMVFIGSSVKFSMYRFLKGGAPDYAVGSGAQKIYYFDGTNFTSQITAFEDGTASGGDCFAQDGYVGFKQPMNWAVGANAFNANLDADKYYIGVMTTTSPTTDPDADILCPCDGQFFEVAFAGMDLAAPVGRPLVPEMLILDRNRANSRMHFIEGPDSDIYAPISVSFSAMHDDTVNKDDIEIALVCGNPDSARWTAIGTTSKGTTKNDGSNYNPAFADATLKTVNVQVLFPSPGTGTDFGWAFYETYFPPAEQNFTEAEDGNVFNLNGGCYGVIERIHGFGNRY